MGVLERTKIPNILNKISKSLTIEVKVKLITPCDRARGVSLLVRLDDHSVLRQLLLDEYHFLRSARDEVTSGVDRALV